MRLEKEPVIARGTAHDVLNPSVVRAGATLFNFVSVFDGHQWTTALTTSADGASWSSLSRVLQPDERTWEKSYIAANGSAYFDGASWWYWYQAGDEDRPEIGLARSADARHWQKEPLPVLSFGPRGSWDERGVADPFVMKTGGTWYLYYLGQNRAHQQQIGLARSNDGVRWEKLRSNPVLTIPLPGSGAPDENGLGEPAVFLARETYWMLYTGRSAQERRSLVAAKSRDGVHWSKQSPAFSGEAGWDSQVICDAAVLMDRERIRMWFGGGDQPKPAENLDGQIGAGEIEIVQ